MKRFYTAESVTEGHPDKLCDLIADSILDECLKGDPEARVACEVLATKGTVLLAGEITSKYEPDVLTVAEDVVEKVGYQAGEILFDALLHQQSPDIAQGVQNSMESRKQHAAGEEWKMGAGDQGVMTGYACSETKQFLPLPVVLAHRIVRELSACRISEYIRGLLPDGKAQVTVEYEDGNLSVWIRSLCPASMLKKSPKKIWNGRFDRKCCARHCGCFHQMRILGF